MNKNFTTKSMTFGAMCIVINIALGTIVGALKVPLLFLDTVGTIFSAVLFGPWIGAVVGGLTNVLRGVMFSPVEIPFALVNIATGVIVGIMAKKYQFNLKTAFVTGAILAVVCPLIGTPISVYVLGGLTGGFSDIFFVWLKQSGAKIFTAAFIPRITGNILDKIISCLLISVVISKMPLKSILGVDINGQK